MKSSRVLCLDIVFLRQSIQIHNLFSLLDPIADLKWYGKVWLKYRTDTTLVQSYFGQLFKAKVEFRAVMNEVNVQCFTKTDSKTETHKLSMQHGHDFTSKLKVWYIGLSVPLHPEHLVLSCHFALQ